MKKFEFEILALFGRWIMVVAAEDQQTAENLMKEQYTDHGYNVKFLGEVPNNVIHIDFVNRRKLA